MSVFAYHLTFNTPLHIGLEGIGQERIEITIRSDTLWGALVQQWGLLFDESPAELAAGARFHVSSCFPVIDGHRYYPVPLGTFDHLFSIVTEFAEELPEPKKLKRIRYIREDLFVSVLQGCQLSIDSIKKAGCHYPRIFDEEGTSAPPFIADQRPRIRIDRLSAGVEENGFFYCTDQFWRDKSGLFFLARFENDMVRKKFESSLELLGDTGIGADRSIGRGGFSFHVQEVTFPSVDKPDQWRLLSLYHPTEKEINSGIMRSSVYHLVRRIGYAAGVRVAGMRRTDVWMLEEGAILGAFVDGDTPEVISIESGAQHPVYRYGRAFVLPAARQGGGGC